MKPLNENSDATDPQIDRKQQVKSIRSYSNYDYQDESKIKEVTLQNQTLAAYSSKKKEGLQDQSVFSNAFDKIKKQFVKRIFKLNFVLLSHYNISSGLCHIVLFLEFLQIFYYIFFKVPIAVEFDPPINVSSYINVNLTLAWASNAMGIVIPEGIIEMGQQSNTIYYRMYELLEFTNFQMFIFASIFPYPFQKLFMSVIIIVFLYILLLAGLSGTLFQLARANEIKDTIKHFIKGLATTLYLFLTIFFMPVTSVLLQGFICNEYTNEFYSVPWIYCGDNNAQYLYPAIATFIVYALFVIIQIYLSTLTDFDSDIPWSELQRKLPLIKTLVKFITIADFQFDKAGVNKAYFLLICSFLTAYILYRRLKDSPYFYQSFHIASIVYDTILCSSFLLVGGHIFGGVLIYVSTLMAYFFATIFIAGFLIFYHQQCVTRILCGQKQLKNTMDWEMFLLYFYQAIQRSSLSDNIIMEGILIGHLDSCDSQQCFCKEVIPLVDLNINTEYDQHNYLDKPQNQGEDLFQVEPLDMVGAAESFFNNGTFMDGGSLTKIQSKTHMETGELYKSESLIKQGESTFFPGSFSQNNMMSLDHDRHNLDKQITEERCSDSKKKSLYLFLLIKVAEGLKKHPENIDLVLISSLIHGKHLGNLFRAMFELIECEKYKPNMHQKLMIFKRKIELQQELTNQHIKHNRDISFIDSYAVVNYQKELQYFHLNEYLATSTALKFWKELLQKNFSTQALQQRGEEIAIFIDNIMESVERIRRKKMDDMLFYFSYGLFLIDVLNNETEGLEQFRKVQQIYGTIINSRAAWHESEFRENSATAIVVMETTSSVLGRIIHTNSEIELVLGFRRNELIHKNVAAIMPLIIGNSHNAFLRRFLESGKSESLEKSRLLFGKTKQGYLQPINLMIKIYPQIHHSILFVGFLQLADNSSFGFDTEHSAARGHESHYITTDEEGFITDISEALTYEIGLHSSFFGNYLGGNDFANRVHIEHICPMLTDPDVSLNLAESNTGTILTLNTTNILEHVDLEKLTGEQLNEIKESIGIYKGLVQVRMFLNYQHLKVKLYRIILINQRKTKANIWEGIMASRVKTRKYSEINYYNRTRGQTLYKGTAKEDIPEVDFESSSSEDEKTRDRIETPSSADDPDMRSQSSTFESGSHNSVRATVKGFKETLNQTKTPLTIKILSRVIMVVLLSIIILSVVCYNMILQDIQEVNDKVNLSFNAQSRSLFLVQLSSNIRTIIDMSSGLEFDLYSVYHGTNQYEKRFDVLSETIQTLSALLTSVHTTINDISRSPTFKEAEQVKTWEESSIQLLTIDEENQLSEYSQPYIIGFFSYLNGVESLTSLSEQVLNFPLSILMVEPILSLGIKLGNTTSEQKIAYFLNTNGLRNYLSQTESTTNYYQSLANVDQPSPTLTGILIIGVVLLLILMISSLALIYTLERIQGYVLSMYPQIQIPHIVNILYKCSSHMDSLNVGSISGLINVKAEDAVDSPEPVNENRVMIMKTFGLYDEKEEEIKEAASNLKQKKRRQRKAALKFSIYDMMIKRINLETFQINENERRVLELQQNEIRRKREEEEKLEIIDETQKGDETFDAFDYDGKRERSASVDSSKSFQDQIDKSQQRRKSSSKSRRRSTKKGKGKKKKEDGEGSTIDPAVAEFNYRKERFKSTWRNSSVGNKLVSIVISFVLCSYFLETFFVQQAWKNDMQQLQDVTPVFINRFKSMILSFSMLRERILYNNSLASFAPDPQYLYEVDQMYLDASLENELTLSQVQASHVSLIDDLSSFFNQQDSPDFCANVIGESSDNNMYNMTLTTNPDSTGTLTQYYDVITTIMYACRAAYSGDLVTLGQLKDQQVDLSLGDYDNRTALYYAVRGNQLGAVKFLVNLGVPVNPIDRWGGTPMNYFNQSIDIKNYLHQAGGRQGVTQNITAGNEDNILLMSDNDFRFYYCALNNDVDTLQVMFDLSWQGNLMDFDGRTPLHVAASSDSLDAFVFLQSQFQIPFMVLDSRGNDCTSDAVLFGSQDIFFYIDQIVSTYLFTQECSTFSSGLFNQGMKAVIGNFQRGFTSMRLYENATSLTYQQRLALLNGTSSTMGQFFYTSEIYFNIVLNQTLSLIIQSYSTAVSDQQYQQLIVFCVYIILQMLALLILHYIVMSILLKQLFRSRGILNLIPAFIIEENKHAAELIINKLRS